MKVQKLMAALLCSAVMAAGGMLGETSAAAAKTKTRYYGDVDRDGTVGVTDIVLLQKVLLGQSTLRSQNAAICADLTQDGSVDVFDLALLKRYVVNGIVLEVDAETTEPTTETTKPAETTRPPETTKPTETTVITETTTTTETTATEPEPTTETTEPIVEPTTEPTEPDTGDGTFIDPPIYELYGSLPSHGTANLVVFYVDFPDCPYTYEPSVEQLTSYCFATTDDPADANYPFESMHAFYNRSSKGQMNLIGQVFRYTTKENKSAYEGDEFKVKFIKEVFNAFNDSVDFSQFDADGDKTIDATLFSVPTAAGDDDWWPCAGQFYDSSFRVDKTYVGHVIYGNAQVESDTDHRNFCSSYLHEMGHCMGLPDYYLYYSQDNIGLHGTAGTELMDIDAYSDFSAFSKLMLGWYTDKQIQVYDQSAGGVQQFKLTNAETDAGNCLILPYGDLDSKYYSEYMILEYTTAEANNSGLNRDWNYGPYVIEPGVRVYHIRADVTGDHWFNSFAYENGGDATGGDDDGIRLIRLANDAEGGSPFGTGDVIDGNLSGFHWYAADESESVETGYSVTIGELADGSYTVTVNKK